MVDEYSGQGGSYLLDPETGKRTLIQRTLPADTQEKDGTPSPQTTDSDRDGIELRNGSDSRWSGRGFGKGTGNHSSAE